MLDGPIVMPEWLRFFRVRAVRQLEGFKIGAHDVGDSAYLGSSPKVVHRHFLDAPGFSERFECDIASDLVAELETVCHCFCRSVDPESCSADGIFLHSEVKRPTRHAYEANRWRYHARRPGFHVNGHPNLVRGLRCELVELKRGQETDYAFRNLVGRFDKRQMLGDAGRCGSVKPASKLSENALSNESLQVISRNAEGENVA
jgi:hypothetical protein